MNDLTALITGSSKGIGLEIANLLAHDKRFKYIHCLARTPTVITSSKVIPHCVDISNIESTRYHLRKIIGKEPLHLLINCAGVCYQNKFNKANFSDIQKEVNVNLLGTMNVTHTLMPNLTSNAHIITISSLMGRVPTPTYSSYCATKFGLVGFSESLRLENPNLNVSCLLPTLVTTDMVSNKQPVSNLIYPVTPQFVAQQVMGLLFKHNGLKAIGAQAELACVTERVSPFYKKFMFS